VAQYENFTKVDFDKIKQSLKDYLANSEEFSDYNFEGSAINTFLDVLSYNTQFNSYYINMLASERFLKTAQKRNSLIHIARTLGYVPSSRKSAVSYISLSLTPKETYTDNTITIPRYSAITSRVDNKTYRYITTKDYTTNEKVAGKFVFTDLPFVEGKGFKYRVQITEDNINGVILPNKGVDKEFIKVVVYDGLSDVTGTEYFLVQDFTQVKGDSNTFFVEEVDNRYHRVFFGDNIIGKGVEVGNIVEVDYIVTNGSESNNSRIFSVGFGLPEISTIQITSFTTSAGGADIEDIEEIRLRASSFYQRQNRAVTSDDYTSIIKELVPSAKDVIAWGGQESSPPLYGVVFISILPENGTSVPEQTKELTIQRLYNRYSTMSTTPKFIDPEYTFVSIDSVVNYDGNLNNPGIEQIRSNVVSTIRSFLDEKVSKFNTNLLYSRLLREIDDSMPIIISSETSISVYKEFLYQQDLIMKTQFDFFRKIIPGSIITSTFTYGGIEGWKLLDNENGSLDLVRSISENSNQIVTTNVFKVDYEKGIIYTNTGFDFRKVSFSITNPFLIRATPHLNDISVIHNSVLGYKSSEIDVKVKDIRTGLISG
jgi:hypothetical protein